MKKEMIDETPLLKPCPHCGGRPNWVYTEEYGDCISCDDCGATVGVNLLGVEMIKDSVAETWNRRIEK